MPKTGREIIFRVDGSKRIGMGHLVRSSFLAEALKKRGYDVTFVTPFLGSEVADFLHSKNFDYTGYLPPQRNRSVIYHKNIMEDKKTFLTLIDTYLESDAYRKGLKDWGATIIAIDDVYEHYSNADLVINHNPSADAKQYDDFWGTTLVGPHYALINPAFAELAPPSNEGTPNILVTMGGSDARDQTGRVVRLLDSVDGDFTITVLQGMFATKGMPKQTRHEVKIIGSTDDMPGLIVQCHSAITAGGVTTMELAASARPFMVLMTDYRQRPNAETWKNSGAGMLGGDTDELSDDDLRSAIKSFIDARPRWAEMGAKGREMVDGKGAERVADVIEEMYG